MKLIAHRALFNGPDQSKENHPNQIIEAWSEGYDCEIDLWIMDHELYLGHDQAQYKIKEDFLSLGPLWIHAKNLEALRFLTDTGLNYFWHQNDFYTLTSKGYIWTYPGKRLSDKSIMLMPEWNDPKFETIRSITCYGICSDYVETIKPIFQNR